MSSVLDRVRDVGYERPRLALGLLSLGFFGMVYLLVGLNAPSGWGPAFVALSACYLAAFVALVCDAFWARWFAGGLGWSGFMVGIASLVMMGWQPQLAMFAGLHFLVLSTLFGRKMAARYEGQQAWRARYGVDEYGVAKLGKTITRAAASLPTLIIWALAPKQGQGLEMGAWIVSLAALSFAVLGMRGALRMRSWSLPLFAAAAAALLWLPDAGASTASFAPFWGAAPLLSCGAAMVSAALLLLAIAPFAAPAWRYFRSLPR